MRKTSNYDKKSVIPVSSSSRECYMDWRVISEQLQADVHRFPFVIYVECYPGVFEQEVEREMALGLSPDAVFRAADCYLGEAEIKSLCQPDLGKSRRANVPERPQTLEAAASAVVVRVPIRQIN